MADGRNPRECIVCNLEFNETEQRPRNLHCSHHVCTKCIEKLINSENRFCPMCREYISARSAMEFKVNYGIEDFMKFTLPIADDKDNEIPMTPTMAKMIKEYETIIIQLIDDCQKRQSQLEVRMQDILPLKVDLKIGMNKMETELKAKLDEFIEENKKIIQNLEKESNLFQELMQVSKNKQKDLSFICNSLGQAKSSMEAAKSLGKADICLSDVGGWMDKHQLPPEHEDILSNAAKVCRSVKEKTFLVLEVLNSKPSDYGITQKDAIPYKKDNLPEMITVNVLQEMNHLVTQIIAQGLLYAVQRVRGQTFCARISQRGNFVYLHHLQNKLPPAAARTIAYKDLSGLMEKSSVVCFLELGSKEDTLGRVHIRLYPNMPRAKNFGLLCTGVKEATYVDSKFLEVWGKGQSKEHLRGGDYDRNRGDGGTPLIPIPLQQEKKTETWKAGLVWGSRIESSASQFFVSTKDDLGEVINSPFGRVEEGLEVLQKSIDLHPDIRQVRITDCGLVLPPGLHPQSLIREDPI